MAPQVPSEEADAHQALLEMLDINSIPKPFRNPHWKPSQRRNKTIKTILSDTIRKEVSNSLLPTTENSGAVTPSAVESSSSTSASVDGESESTPVTTTQPQPNLAQASRNLSKLVRERNMKAMGGAGASAGGGVGATYTNIESAPSMAHAKHYCDVTGLAAPYTDPKTRLRYHDKEVFGVIRGMGQGVAELYLEARGAHTVLK
ncbi:hypothetical protein LZ554_005568 [Drepanopeziza brunnea f. sp. 'monogermtubi']|nr:hypothetical protein LZ554_005568 [Drepanopeziza brunnea f. sp. 'monogermtubi']